MKKRFTPDLIASFDVNAKSFIKPRTHLRGFFIMVAVLALFVSLIPTNSIEAVQPAKTINIVALGDSYSAGNGAVGIDGGYYGQNPCHRSTLTYSDLYAKQLRSIKDDNGENKYIIQYNNSACMGWVTSQVSAQLDQPGILGTDTDIVTLTIGGNDFKFSDIAVYCMVNTREEFTETCINKIHAAALEAGNVRASTTALLEKIKAKAPTAEIVLLGYPQLIGDCDYTKVLGGQELVHGKNQKFITQFEQIQAILGGGSSRVHDQSSASLIQVIEDAQTATENTAPNLIVPVGDTLRGLQYRFEGIQAGVAATAGERVQYIPMADSSFARHELMCNYPQEYLNSISSNASQYAGFVHPNTTGHEVYKNGLAANAPHERINPSANALTTTMANAIVYDPADEQDRSYFYDDQGRLHHIPDQETFQCIKTTNGREFHVKQAVIDDANHGNEIRCVHKSSAGVYDIFAEVRRELHDIDGPHIIRTLENDNTMLYINNAFYNIPDASTFNCFGGWNVATIFNGYDFDFAANALSIDAHCFDANTAIAQNGNASYLIEGSNITPITSQAEFDCISPGHPNRVTISDRQLGFYDMQNADSIDCFNDDYYAGKIVRFDDNKNYFIAIENGQRTFHHIPSNSEYDCLLGRGHKIVPGEEPNIRKYANEGPTAECFNDSDFAGKIIDVGGNAKYFIAINGDSRKFHHIPDQATYQCLVGRGHTDIGSQNLTYVSKYTTNGGEASCFDDANFAGKIIDFGTSAKYFISINGSERKYNHIPDSATYNCLVGRGHPDIGTHDESYVKKHVGNGGDASCVDKSFYRGNIITMDGASYYVHNDDSYQWIKWQGDHQCYTSIGSKVRANADRNYIDEHFNFVGGNASCFKGNDFKNKVVTIKNSSASYVVVGNTIQHIPSAATYHCILERPGYKLTSNVELGYLQENLTVLGGNAGCASKAKLKGHVVRRDADGTYWYMNPLNGYRYQLANSYHTSCSKVRYGYVGTVKSIDVSKYRHTSTKKTCPDINYWKGKIVRNSSNGAIYYVNGNGQRRHIGNWERYKCFSRKYDKNGYTNVSSTTISRLPAGPGMGGCIEPTIRNKIIRRSNGTSYWIDAGGRRFWIPNGTVFNCFGGWNRIINDVTYETTVKHRYYGTARCYNGTLLNNRVIRHSTGGDAHYVEWNGNRHWLRSGSAYWRYVNATGAHINIPRYAINAVPYVGSKW